MITLDPYRNIKRAAKLAGIFVGIALVLILIIAGYQKMKPVPAGGLPIEAPGKSMGKQEEMLNAINEANQNEKLQSEVEKRQQEMASSINDANMDSQQAAQNEQDQEAQDMLNAINEANK